jgi:flavin reductase (DIM6/NTAB) family NADH-FMN oxidoreductase RutF
MFYEPHIRDKDLLPHDPFKAMVVPRPVGWVSSRSANGDVNLAPYSFFNGFASRPNIIGFSSEGPKDSLTFITETREFVWNMATFALRDRMNLTSAPLPRGENEFAHAGLDAAPCRIVNVPRVAASPCALECKLLQIIDLKDLEGRSVDAYLVLGQVVGVHIDDAFIKDGRFDTVAAQPIARLGYADYSVVDEVFALTRPLKA